MKHFASFDSSFWIHVHRAGLLALVLERYALRFAPVVASELRETFPSGRAFWECVRDGQITEVAPRLQTVQEFGPGERAAMNVALEHRDWLLLLDDQRPFRDATARGLRAICSPVLVVALYVEGRIGAQEALTSLARLAALGTVSPHLGAAALAQLGTVLRAARKEGD